MPGDFDISDKDFQKELAETFGSATEAKEWRDDMTTLLNAVKALQRPLETLGDPEE